MAYGSLILYEGTKKIQKITIKKKARNNRQTKTYIFSFFLLASILYA